MLSLPKFNRPSLVQEPTTPKVAKREASQRDMNSAASTICFSFPEDSFSSAMDLLAFAIEVHQNIYNPPGFNYVTNDPRPSPTPVKKSKSGKLPVAASRILKSWIWANVEKPYPTESEKARLAAETGLTLIQINNWMSNARRRLLKKHRFTRPSRKQKI